jgi:AmiR/NasT family two-component response regulator
MDEISGAVNIYGRRPAGFTDEDVTLAQSFAGYAAVALANAYLYHRTAEHTQQLQAAMDSRAVIEQAKGIIMAELRCSADDAYAFLARSAQDRNCEVWDVAAAVVVRTQKARGKQSR